VVRGAWRLVLGLGLAVATAGAAVAEKDGIDSTLYFDGAVGCGSAELGEQEGCHANPKSDLVQVSLQGPDRIDEGGGLGVYTATVMTDIQGQQGSGINVLLDPQASTSDCQLDAFPQPGSDPLVFEGAVLTHRDAESPPPLGSIGVFSYQFLLIDCNTPGTVRLLVAMNTMNFDGESTGDAWNETEKTVTVPEPAGAGLAAALALAGAALARRRCA
jgi:hypothetical protein